MHTGPIGHSGSLPSQLIPSNLSFYLTKMSLSSRCLKTCFQVDGAPLEGTRSFRRENLTEDIGVTWVRSWGLRVQLHFLTALCFLPSDAMWPGSSSFCQSLSTMMGCILSTFETKEPLPLKLLYIRYIIPATRRVNTETM